jgi:hypothetical protein
MGAMGGMGGSMCKMTYAADPRDDTMTGELVRLVTKEGDPNDPTDDRYDLELPKEMVAWLQEQNWVQAHGDWHNIRRWDQQCGGKSEGCAAIEQMKARGLWRAEIQEQGAGDGYAFLVMHRHMIEGFKQVFPKHADILSGFATVPMSQDDKLNPVPWVDVQWNATQKAAIALIQDIEKNLSLFDSEDDLGLWLQYASKMSGPGGGMGGGPPGFGGGPPGGFDGGPPGAGGGPPGGFDGGPPGSSSGGPGAGGGSTTVSMDSKGRPEGGLHGALHAQWTIVGSPIALTDNNTNTQLYAFWRLHGWIDPMWERYRVAKGITSSDAAYQKEMEDQCEEMEKLKAAKPRDTTGDAGTETGVFATDVAPILKSYCGGCHDSSSPSQGLVLAGTTASKIRTGLVSVKATETSLLLVDPASADDSWLVRKIEGNFTGVTCTSACQTQMPPAGTAPTMSEIETIRDWIAAGATAD